MRAFIIKDIEMEEVPDHRHYIDVIQFNYEPRPLWEEMNQLAETTNERVVIRDIPYRGERVRMGMTESVAAALDIPWAHIDGIEKQAETFLQLSRLWEEHCKELLWKYRFLLLIENMFKNSRKYFSWAYWSAPPGTP